MGWADRVVEHSPSVRRSRDRTIEQARAIVDGARRLVRERGGADVTTQELAKEAGVALQTFYRYFGSKDELLLAVFEEEIVVGCDAMRANAAALPDPIARLHYYITGAEHDDEPAERDLARTSRYIASEHYRLHQIFPDELTRALRPFTEMIIPDIRAAADEGLLAPRDVERDAWFVTQLVMAAFHHRAFAADGSTPGERAALWAFCVSALGGARCVVERSRDREAHPGRRSTPSG